MRVTGSAAGNRVLSRFGRSVLNRGDAGSVAAAKRTGGISEPARGGTQRRALLLAVSVGALCWGSACATVKSYRYDPKKDQEGIPYYRPRPYVAVKEPFPLGGHDLLVPGTVNDKGEITVATEALPPELKESFAPSRDEKRLLVPRARVGVRLAQSLEELHQQATEPDKGKAGGKVGGGAKKEGTGQVAEDTAPGSQDKPGDKEPEPASNGEPKADDKADGSLAVSGGSPLLPVSKVFDVVFLPDMDETWLLRFTPGLGKLKVAASLQGGMLAGLSIDADNTAVGALVTSIVKTALDVGKQFALSKLPPTESADEEVEELAQQATTAEPRPVTLRIRLTTEAVPGLYPVLKKDELELTPPPDRRRSLLLPVGPYTRIAFEARSTLEVELLTKDRQDSADPSTIPTPNSPQPLTSEQKSALCTLLRGEATEPLKKASLTADRLVLAQRVDDAKHLILTFAGEIGEGERKELERALKQLLKTKLAKEGFESATVRAKGDGTPFCQ